MQVKLCPSRQELSAYLVGKLPEEILEAIAEHLDKCNDCQSSLPSLSGDGEDAIVSKLKQPLSRTPPGVDPELERLLAKAKSVPPGNSAHAIEDLATARVPIEQGPAKQPEHRQIDQYRILEKIGQGGMGTVYKALHVQLEKIVALKVLPEDQVNDATALARFQREMKAVGRLNHPNIVHATDARQADGVYFLVMELVEGIDLHKLARRAGRLPVADACELVRQTALGLQHAHEHDLIHRDIKPSNLILGLDGQVKILDMGLARLHSERSTREDLTPTGQTMGTLDYMAPEQAGDARHVDIRADLYSLGCTLYHLLNGHPPFSGSKYSHPAQKIAAHLMDKAPSIQKDRPEVPDALAAVLERLLAKQPSDRYAAPGEVANALKPFALGSNLADLLSSIDLRPEHRIAQEEQALIETKPTRTSSPSTHADMKAPVLPRRRNRSVLVLACAGWVLGLGLIFAGYAWFSSRQGGDPEKIAQQTTGAIVEEKKAADTPKEQTAGKEKAARKETPADAADKPAEKEKDQHVGNVPPQPPADVAQTPAEKEKPPRKEPPPAERKQPPPEPEPPAAAAVPPGELPHKGYTVLKQYCYRCHGIDFKVPGFNVLDRNVLVAERGKEDPPYVVPGKPERSHIWQRVGIEADMPPGKTKPSAAEKQILKQWIEAGAPFPGRPTRPFKSESAVLTAIRDHLRAKLMEDRKFQRYFTLTHLYNNHAHVTADEMRLYRAALAKLVNSLSWRQELVIPRPIDAEGTVFNVDLRDLGWDEHELWKEILKAYPYGLTHNHDADEKMRALAQEIYEMTSSNLPYLRADWFIASASRPPLYHTMLRLPSNAYQLEAQLKVDVDNDFLRDKLARGGLMTSGVSKQNRIVDRHPSVYGAYWKSYDFKSNEGNGNLPRYPLGPVFARNPYPKQAFEHAGGEIVFNLPNGLQGYLLTDDKGRRIDAGPIDVVRDSQETAGTPAIVNGLSCMACHKHGVVRFEDKLRNASAAAGEAQIKVQQLFRKKDDMDKLLEKDETRFLKALEEAVEPFLKAGDDKNKNIREFPEPIGAIARLYVADIDLAEVALELGIDDPKKLETLIRGNRKLRELGLGPLVEGGKIKREVWSSVKFATSLFHEAARELGLGTPLIVF